MRRRNGDDWWLNIAAKQLQLSLRTKSKEGKRRRVLSAVRQLISWLAGKSGPDTSFSGGPDEPLCDTCFCPLGERLAGGETCLTCRFGPGHRAILKREVSQDRAMAEDQASVAFGRLTREERIEEHTVRVEREQKEQDERRADCIAKSEPMPSVGEARDGTKAIGQEAVARKVARILARAKLPMKPGEIWLEAKASCTLPEIELALRRADYFVGSHETGYMVTDAGLAARHARSAREAS